jgi:hypothetical protein
MIDQFALVIQQTALVIYRFARMIQQFARMVWRSVPMMDRFALVIQQTALVDSADSPGDSGLRTIDLARRSGDPAGSP